MPHTPLHEKLKLISVTKVKEDEMGRACSTNEGEEECI
jgi:hypothetical protein